MCRHYYLLSFNIHHCHNIMLVIYIYFFFAWKLNAWFIPPKKKKHWYWLSNKFTFPLKGLHFKLQCHDFICSLWYLCEGYYISMLPYSINGLVEWKMTCRFKCPYLVKASFLLLRSFLFRYDMKEHYINICKKEGISYVPGVDCSIEGEVKDITALTFYINIYRLYYKIKAT